MIDSLHLKRSALGGRKEDISRNVIVAILHITAQLIPSPHTHRNTHMHIYMHTYKHACIFLLLLLPSLNCTCLPLTIDFLPFLLSYSQQKWNVKCAMNVLSPSVLPSEEEEKTLPSSPYCLHFFFQCFFCVFSKMKKTLSSPSFFACALTGL